MFYLGIDQHAKQLTISLLNDQGDVVLKRQVSTEPERCHEFLTQLNDKTSDQGGYMAIVEVCGFNDWLIGFVPCSISMQDTSNESMPSLRDSRFVVELPTRGLHPWLSNTTAPPLKIDDGDNELSIGQKKSVAFP